MYEELLQCYVAQLALLSRSFPFHERSKLETVVPGSAGLARRSLSPWMDLPQKGCKNVRCLVKKLYQVSSFFFVNDT